MDRKKWEKGVKICRKHDPEIIGYAKRALIEAGRDLAKISPELVKDDYKITISAEEFDSGIAVRYGARVVIEYSGCTDTSFLLSPERDAGFSSEQQAVSFAKETLEIIKRAKVVVRK